MTSNEQAILATLVELENRVSALTREANRATPGLLPLFDRLRQLTAEMPATTDPTLLHYLHKQSWQKARLWLQGRESENASGNCGHL